MRDQLIGLKLPSLEVILVGGHRHSNVQLQANGRWREEGLGIKDYVMRILRRQESAGPFRIVGRVGSTSRSPHKKFTSQLSCLRISLADASYSDECNAFGSLLINMVHKTRFNRGRPVS
jgi:hypothetical protein